MELSAMMGHCFWRRQWGLPMPEMASQELGTRLSRGYILYVSVPFALQLGVCFQTRANRWLKLWPWTRQNSLRLPLSGPAGPGPLSAFTPPPRTGFCSAARVASHRTVVQWKISQMVPHQVGWLKMYSDSGCFSVMNRVCKLGLQIQFKLVTLPPWCGSQRW